MAKRTITSANSVITMNIPDVFDTPIQLQGYEATDAFDTEDAEPVEARKGVDGIMSAGFTPFMTKQTFHFMADSASIDSFELWLAQMKQQEEVIWCTNGEMVLQSVGKVYSMANGVMSRIKQTPDGKKVLEGQAFEITWDTVDVSYTS
jgi:hypothetical protein